MNMDGLVNKREETIAEEIDKWNNFECKFALWLLLKGYVNELETTTKTYAECNDKLELASEIMKANHIKVGKEMIECLTYDLW